MDPVEEQPVGEEVGTTGGGAEAPGAAVPPEPGVPNDPAEPGAPRALTAPEGAPGQRQATTLQDEPGDTVGWEIEADSFVGLGVMLLALFSLWGMRDINVMNGLKTGLSFVLSGISVVIFAVAGLVEWPQAWLMMIAATAGGYCGASVARVLPAAVVRATVILIGLAMSAVFFAALLD